MLEKSIERYLLERVKALGGMAIKLDSEKGLPDRLVLDSGGHHYFIELKRPEGTLSPIQAEYHKRLKDRGHTVLVLWSYNDVNEFIEKIFKVNLRRN